MTKNTNERNNVKAILKADMMLWEKYGPEGAMKYSLEDYPGYQMTNPGFAILWMESNVEYLLVHGADAEKIREDLIRWNLLDTTDDRFANKVRLDRIIKAANVRRNWADALRNISYGRKLSPVIEWGLSPEDISELAKLHQKNRFRKKIEDLLEDCNFHYECGKFVEGDYKEFLKGA